MPKLSIVKKHAKFPKDATFPPPEGRYTFKDDPKPGTCAGFFAYWKQIAGWKGDPDPRGDLVIAKFYLHTPKILMKLANPTLKNNVFREISGPLWFENPEDYMEEVPKKLGAGDWFVVLNEMNIHGALAEAYFEAGTWDEYPPQVDLRTLLRNDPKNEDYLRWLKKTGVKTPWDNPNEEEDEMQGEMAKVLVETFKEQAESAQEAQKELAEIRIEAAQEEADRARAEAEKAKADAATDAKVSANLEMSAVNKSMEILATGANKAMEMVTKNAGSQLDTVQIMKTAFEFSKRDDTGITMLVDTIKSQGQTMLQMQEKQNEFMQNLIGMKKQADGTWSAPQLSQQQAAPKSFDEELMRIKTVAEVLGWSRPGSGAIMAAEPPAPPRKSIWDAVAENPIPFMTGLSAILTLGANIVYNIFAGKGGTAVHPNEALQRAQAQPAPNPQQPQQQQPQPASKDPKDPRNWAGLGQFLENSLRTHLLGKDQSLNGYSFAEHLLSEMNGGAPTLVGRQRYDAMRTHLGPVQFVNLICMHPPIMELRQNNEANFMKFIEEFFGYDEYMATQQQGQAA
jgi:actin-related protein